MSAIADRLKELRRIGVQSISFDGEGKPISVAFFELTDEDRREMTLESMDASERAWVESLSDDQKEKWQEAQRDLIMHWAG